MKKIATSKQFSLFSGSSFMNVALTESLAIAFIFGIICCAKLYFCSGNHMFRYC